jgi:putative glutamine amidotransferase
MQLASGSLMVLLQPFHSADTFRRKKSPNEDTSCEPPSEKLMPLSEYEIWAALWRLAIDGPKPVFAICGGFQVLNVMLGGTLTQDIPSQTGSKVSHRNENRPPDPMHEIDIEADSRLAGILGTTHLTVNSAHHQAVDRVGEGLRITAHCSADGIIEAGEVPEHPFLVAVQWHPERFFEGDSSERLFKAFVQACREYR